MKKREFKEIRPGDVLVSPEGKEYRAVRHHGDYVLIQIETPHSSETDYLHDVSADLWDKPRMVHRCSDRDLALVNKLSLALGRAYGHILGNYYHALYYLESVTGHCFKVRNAEKISKILNITEEEREEFKESPEKGKLRVVDDLVDFSTRYYCGFNLLLDLDSLTSSDREMVKSLLGSAGRLCISSTVDYTDWSKHIRNTFLTGATPAIVSSLFSTYPFLFPAVKALTTDMDFSDPVKEVMDRFGVYTYDVVIEDAAGDT